MSAAGGRTRVTADLYLSGGPLAVQLRSHRDQPVPFVTVALPEVGVTLFVYDGEAGAVLAEALVTARNILAGEAPDPGRDTVKVA